MTDDQAIERELNTTDSQMAALFKLWSETRVPILAHIERILVEHQVQHKVEHAASEQKALLLQEQVKVAKDATEDRFKESNEFRGQLKDQASSFITRDAVLREFERIGERLSVVERTSITREVFEREMLRLAERLNGIERATTSYATKIEVEKQEKYTKDRADSNAGRIDKLENWRAEVGGRDRGVGLVWGVIGGGIGLLGAVVAIVVAFNSNG